PLVGKRVTACGAACGDSVTTLPLSARPRTDIWAWGFRNPWRFWFDPKTKNLWVGDVGEVTYEEIDVIPPSGKGKHYGWPWREGGKGHPTSTCREITPDAGDCVDPQYYCRHGASADGIDGDCESITGGLIVDSCAFPATFRGRYFFADNANSWLATLQPTADRNGIVPGSREMFLTGGSNTLPVHLDVGPDGALYFAEIRPGKTGVIERVYPKHPESCGSGTPDGGKSHDGGNAQSDGSDAAESRIDASVDGGVVPLARPTTGSACGCRIAERESTSTPFVLSLSLVGLMLARRRRRV
ncbi:MAG: PQQ-dependent sugar dehydrogenase, partial [Thermoanaerobaculia bacterium]